MFPKYTRRAVNRLRRHNFLRLGLLVLIWTHPLHSHWLRGWLVGPLAVAFVAVVSALFTMLSLVVGYVGESPDKLGKTGFKGLAGFEFAFFLAVFFRPGMGLWYIRGLFWELFFFQISPSALQSFLRPGLGTYDSGTSEAFFERFFVPVFFIFQMSRCFPKSLPCLRPFTGFIRVICRVRSDKLQPFVSKLYWISIDFSGLLLADIAFYPSSPWFWSSWCRQSSVSSLTPFYLYCLQPWESELVSIYRRVGGTSRWGYSGRLLWE